MKRHALAAALILGGLVPALAQAQQMVPVADLTTVRPLIGLMGTFGGDKLADVIYTDGTTSSVTAGGTVYFYAGAEIHPAHLPFSILATVGYHASSAGGNNGDVRFERIPLEALALFDVVPGVFRLGGGLQYAMNANLNSSGVVAAPAVSFGNALGGVVQAEWMLNPHFGIEARYVNERYSFDAGNGNTGHVDGSHGGVGVNWYF